MSITTYFLIQNNTIVQEENKLKGTDMFAYRQNKIETSIGETWIEVAIICENQVKHRLKAAQNKTINIINYLK